MTTLTKMAAPVLVLGGAYSGKSDLAAQLLAPDLPAAVIGTAPTGEPAFQARLADLRARRPPGWETLDAGMDLAAAVQTAAGRFPQVMIDSVSQWLAGILVAKGTLREELLHAEAADQVDELMKVIRGATKTRLVVVSAEVGHGPAPARGMERLYRQQVGLANIALARMARTVVLVTAGLPQVLKGG